MLITHLNRSAKAKLYVIVIYTKNTVLIYLRPRWRQKLLVCFCAVRILNTSVCIKVLVIKLMRGRSRHAHAVVAVHFKPSPVVHSLLLFLQLSHLLADNHTLRNRAHCVLALLSMDTKQRPYPLANPATALDLSLWNERKGQNLVKSQTNRDKQKAKYGFSYLALPSMLQIILHLGAICRRT